MLYTKYYTKSFSPSISQIGVHPPSLKIHGRHFNDLAMNFGSKFLNITYFDLPFVEPGPSALNRNYQNVVFVIPSFRAGGLEFVMVVLFVDVSAFGSFI